MKSHSYSSSRRIFHKALPCLLLAALCLQPATSQAGLGLWADIALGRFGKAEQDAEKSIRSPRDETSANLAPLCLSLSRLKRYDKLFDCIDRLDRRIAAGDSVVSGFLIPTSDVRPMPDMLRGEAWLELNDTRKAAEAGESALAKVDNKKGSTWGPLPPKGYRVELLTLLGTAYALLGEEDKARNELKALAELDLSDTQPQKFENIRYVGLARIDMALGEYEAALQQMAHEHEKWVRGLSDLVLGAGKDSVGTIYDLPKLLMIGKAQSALGQKEKAMKTLDGLLTHPRIADQGDIHWIALFERGSLAEHTGNTDDAIKYYLQSIDVIEQQRASLTTEAGKIGFVGDKQAVYAHLINALIAQGRIAEAFDYVERSKSRALVDMLASKQDFAAPDPEQAHQVLAQLDSSDLAARALNEDAQPTGTTRNLKLAQASLRSAMPELSSLVTVTSVPSTELSSMLGPDETLVEYYYSNNDLFAFVLGPAGISVSKIDGTNLDAQVRELRTAIGQPGTTAWEAASRTLYDKLWQPLAASVTTKNVIIVPHGILHYLPFAPLQAANGSMLIDRFNMRFLPSASVLKFLRPAIQHEEEAQLVLGNPDLGNPALDLQFAGEEAKMVGELAPDSRVLLRKDASESNFRKVAAAFPRIHFATHGKFQSDKPLASGLYLAKDADNDGVLTVGELYSMNLDADLVTLSACETGLGKIASGDDVVGLTRGFLYAGSRSIVASLWSVDDQATSSLMQAFYKNLASMDKEEALRQAQITTRASFPHPYYWAAFQLTGRAD